MAGGSGAALEGLLRPIKRLPFVPSLTGLQVLLPAYPALTCRATFFRPCGEMAGVKRGSSLHSE
jgi:hypothetical protein